MKYTAIELPDDFEKGDCHNCPFQYYEANGFDGCDSRCVFNYRYDECPLQITKIDPSIWERVMENEFRK